MVTKTSILLGDDAPGAAKDLLAKGLITNWQDFGPDLVNTARILIAVNGDESAYEEARDNVIAEAASRKVAWRRDDFLKYGDPKARTWIPPLP